MILVKGYGQMCNNILQFAHLYAFGREKGVKVVSLRFAYKYRYFALCRRWYHNPLTYLIGKLLIATRLIPCLTDEDIAQADVRLQSTRLIASGAWTIRYPELFLKYREEIRQLFEIKPSICRKVDRWLEVHPQTDIRLGLHIRRGDYIRWQGGKYFFADEVYHRLVQEFVALHPGQSVGVYICTNDPTLCLESFRAIHPATYLSQGSGIEDLRLLASCDYIIGVKSTFSLWASFYRHVPFFWVMDENEQLTAQSFMRFEDAYTTV